MSEMKSKHHLFAFGHNPFQKLGPPPSPSSKLSKAQTASSILSTPTDVLPHLLSSCDHIIQSSLKSSGSSMTNGDVEIKADFIWSCYSSSLIKLRWSWLANSHEDSGNLTNNEADMSLAGTEATHEVDHRQSAIDASTRSESAMESQLRAAEGKDREGKSADLGVSRIIEPSLAVAEQTVYQAKRCRRKGYQHVLLGHPPDDIDPILLVPKKQNDNVRSVDQEMASAEDQWTTLLSLPEDIKVIGFDQLDAFLDLKSGSISPIGQSRPGSSGGVSDSSDVHDESQCLDKRVPEKWKDAATLTDGTVYLVSTSQEDESSQTGIWEFESVDSLLRVHRGRATACRFIPVPVASMPPVSAAPSSRSTPQPILTLHPGHSHLLIHSPLPYAQTFGLGDNRFHSACPSVSTNIGSLRTPREIDALTAVPITWIGGGDGISGAISEAGEAWTWGKGVGPGMLEDVSMEGYDDVDAKFMAVAEDYALVITEDNRVWGRGRNDWGQLGYPPTNSLETFRSSPQTQGYSGWKSLPFFEQDTWEIKRMSAKNWSTWISCIKTIRHGSCEDD